MPPAGPVEKLEFDKLENPPIVPEVVDPLRYLFVPPPEAFRLGIVWPSYTLSESLNVCPLHSTQPEGKAGVFVKLFSHAITEPIGAMCVNVLSVGVFPLNSSSTSSKF